MDSSKASLFNTIPTLVSFQLFLNMTGDKVAELCADGKVLEQKHREALFNEGTCADKFGIVLSGAYKLSKLNELGEESVIHFSTAGDVVGALAMTLPNPQYPITARAMGPSKVLLISRKIYLEKWINEPELITRLHRLLSGRMARFQKLRSMQRAPLSSRLAALLLELSVDKGQSEIPLQLTRQELADTLGVAVESVIRIMSDWAKREIIQTEKSRIRILQVGQLKQEGI